MQSGDTFIFFRSNFFTCLFLVISTRHVGLKLMTSKSHALLTQPARHPNPQFFKIFSLLFLFSFQFGKFCWLAFKLTDSLLSSVQSTDETIRDTSFLLWCFSFSAFPFDYFLVFPSLCLYYPSVWAVFNVCSCQMLQILLVS